MLKSLFTSNVRVKLLKHFFMHSLESFFVRQLTRDLDEQINAIRRELESLKKIWLLKCNESQWKKYFSLNKNFVFYWELSSMILKNFVLNTNLKKDLDKLWDVDYVSVSWIFVNKDSDVDLFIVWDIELKELKKYLDNEIWDKKINFALISKKEFNYRLDINDSFLLWIVRDKQALILINRVKQKLEKFV